MLDTVQQREKCMTYFLSLFLPLSLKDNSGLESSCDMTEKRIFIMAGQVASALVGLPAADLTVCLPCSHTAFLR